MAIKIYISGNFLITEDSVTKNPYFKIKKDLVHHFRNEKNQFAFFHGITETSNGKPQGLQLGIQTSWTWDSTKLEPEHKTQFEFDEILDKDGDPYSTPDVLDDYLNDNLGIQGVYVIQETDVKNYYEERWDQFSPNFSNTWQTLILPNSPFNKVVIINIDSNSNNVTLGVREVGSSLVRRMRSDNDSNISFTVKTNDVGAIEVYTSNTNARFFVQCYLKQ